MNPVKTARTLIPVGTVVAAGGSQYGTLDLRTAWGGRLAVKLTNGGTPPSSNPTVNILHAVTDGATPAAAPAGAVWKTLYSFSGDQTANSIVEFPIPPIDDEIMHLAVEVLAGAGQAVTAEALFSEVSGTQ